MSKCPVEVGDVFYRATDKINIPDRLEVLAVNDHNGLTIVRARYMYHKIGPVFERTFDARIFNDPQWVIEKKGGKTA